MSNNKRVIGGILGTKLGVAQLWDENNKVVPATAIQIGSCVVAQIRISKRGGYNAVQLGFRTIAPRKTTKPTQGHFDKAGVTLRRYLLEPHIANAPEFILGRELAAELFADGEVVGVTGTTKGKDATGMTKRRGFSSLKGSHGVHRKYRTPGPIGDYSIPGRMFKGLHMTGRVGSAKVTAQNFKIHAADAERGLLLICGAVSGNNGSLVVVRGAAKKSEQA